MSRMIDYYDVLGIPRNSDDVEVKKAYRRLALKYHPDIDATEEAAREFALAGEAYDVLSNPKRKGIYDLYGSQQFKAGLEGEEPYTFDPKVGPRAVFSKFFGTNNPYEALEVLSARFEKLTAAKQPPPPQQKLVDMLVALEEVYHGCTKTVLHSRVVSRSSEAGEAATEARRLTLHIEPGMAEGTTFVFQGEGDIPPPGSLEPPGVLHLVLRTAPHDRFTRRGSDLAHRVRLPLYNALAGGLIPVKTLDGRVLNVPLDEIITPGATIRVSGEGLPRPGSGGASRGDLVVEFDLLFPSNLTLQQKLLLKGALFLPPKIDEVQAKALRTFETAFKDSQHGWSTGVLPAKDGSTT